jgi:hypothetical protein
MLDEAWFPTYCSMGPRVHLDHARALLAGEALAVRRGGGLPQCVRTHAVAASSTHLIVRRLNRPKVARNGRCRWLAGCVVLTPLTHRGDYLRSGDESIAKPDVERVHPWIDAPAVPQP